MRDVTAVRNVTAVRDVMAVRNVTAVRDVTAVRECDGSAGMRQQRESIRTMQKYGGNMDMEERQT